MSKSEITDQDIETFGSVLEELKTQGAARREEREELQTEMRDECARLWKEHRGKRKYPGGVLATQEVPEIADAFLAFQEIARELLRRQGRSPDDTYVRLERLVKATPVPINAAGLDPVLWETVSSSTYSSQGFGAVKYARGDAESKADKAKLYGLTPEVRKVNAGTHKGGGGGCSVGHADFEVWVDTSETGLELLNRKPDVLTKDWVDSCDSRGVNPRVYSPMMSYAEVEEARA